MSCTAVIIQARMGSSRLPAKVMRDLGGRPVLEHVLRRCQNIPNADTVVCAVPEGPENDPIVSLCEAREIVVVRGDESDVLGRYHKAAMAVKADVILRVTSDCPLIDFEVCDAVLTLREQENSNYACNNMPPSFPHGLDCEAFTMTALDMAHRQANTAHQREHVTPWLRQNSTVSRTALSGPGGSVTDHRWTLDYPEDLDFFQALFAHIVGDPTTLNYRAILKVLDSNPTLNTINSNHRGVSRPHV